jgi:hypothetical protein
MAHPKSIQYIFCPKRPSYFIEEPPYFCYHGPPVSAISIFCG